MPGWTRKHPVFGRVKSISTIIWFNLRYLRASNVVWKFNTLRLGSCEFSKVWKARRMWRLESEILNVRQNSNDCKSHNRWKFGNLSFHGFHDRKLWNFEVQRSEDWGNFEIIKVWRSENWKLRDSKSPKNPKISWLKILEILKVQRFSKIRKFRESLTIVKNPEDLNVLRNSKVQKSRYLEIDNLNPNLRKLPASKIKQNSEIEKSKDLDSPTLDSTTVKNWKKIRFVDEKLALKTEKNLPSGRLKLKRLRDPRAFVLPVSITASRASQPRHCVPLTRPFNSILRGNSNSASPKTPERSKVAHPGNALFSFGVLPCLFKETEAKYGENKRVEKKSGEKTWWQTGLETPLFIARQKFRPTFFTHFFLLLLSNELSLLFSSNRPHTSDLSMVWEYLGFEERNDWNWIANELKSDAITKKRKKERIVV